MEKSRRVQKLPIGPWISFDFQINIIADVFIKRLRERGSYVLWRDGEVWGNGMSPPAHANNCFPHSSFTCSLTTPQANRNHLPWFPLAVKTD